MPKRERPPFVPRDSYEIGEFAIGVSLSIDQLRRHMNGELKPQVTPGYSGTKPIFTEEQRKDFLRDLPREPQKAS